jgi:sulfonate dioxygenase
MLVLWTQMVIVVHSNCQ